MKLYCYWVIKCTYIHVYINIQFVFTNALFILRSAFSMVEMCWRRDKTMVSSCTNFSINERRRPLWDLKEKYFRIEIFYYAAIANRFPLTILSKFLFCRRKFWWVSGFYLDYDHCSLRCPSDVKTTSKLKKKINPYHQFFHSLSAILQRKQVMLTNPCLCSVGCATKFVLIVEESLYFCDWCYIWTNAFCLFFYFIIITNFFCFFFNKIKFVSF